MSPKNFKVFPIFLKQFLKIIPLVAWLCCFTSVLDETAFAQNNESALVKAIIKKTLAAHTFELKRVVSFYHYGKNPDGNVDVHTDDRALAEKYFYDPQSQRSFFNHAHYYSLYTANNPLVSLDYSRDPALLLKITVPKGVRFLNYGRLIIAQSEYEIVKKYLLSEGLDPNAIYDYFDLRGPSFNLYEFLDASLNSAALLKSVFEELKIQMIEDPFRSNIFPECAGSNPEIKFIDPSLLPKLKLKLFTLNIPAAATSSELEDYRLIYQDFKMVSAEEINKIKNSVEPHFWEYYKNWTLSLLGLNKSSDLNELKKNQYESSLSMRANRVEAMFGCSHDPRFQEEIYNK